MSITPLSAVGFVSLHSHTPSFIQPITRPLEPNNTTSPLLYISWLIALVVAAVVAAVVVAVVVAVVAI